MKLASKNMMLLLLVVILFVAPLLFVKGEYGGADGMAEEAITEIRPDYEPWFSPIMEPASGEIESLLFALQAAAGSGVLFYGIGYLMGKRKGAEEKAQTKNSKKQQ